MRKNCFSSSSSRSRFCSTKAVVEGDTYYCSCQLSVISYQLSVISYQLSVFSFQFSVFSFQLSVSVLLVSMLPCGRLRYLRRFLGFRNAPLESGTTPGLLCLFQEGRRPSLLMCRPGARPQARFLRCGRSPLRGWSNGSGDSTGLDPGAGLCHRERILAASA